MRVFHVGMLMTDGTNTMFEGMVLDCRWTNKRAGKWRGKMVACDPFRLQQQVGCDWCAVARAEVQEAAKRGLPALVQTFPMHCPSCGMAQCQAAN